MEQPVVMGDCGPERTYPVGRYIGGMGHELGHAFGLPHPPGCDQGLPSCDSNALMWAGFYDFPRTPYLRADDKATLLNSPNLRNNAPAPCTYEIGPTGSNPTAGGGGGTVNINTSPGCAWSAAVEVNWITLANGASRSGPGSLEFTAAFNPGPARAAAIYIANKTYVVTQPAGAAAQTPENALLLSQFVSGPEWNSTLVLNNLSNQAENFTLSFYDDDGRAKLMPIVGLGLVQSIAGSLKAKETRRLQTAQLGAQQVAWGLLIPGTPATQRLSGLAVLRQTVPKEQTSVSSEASVDLVPISESRYVALYDNTNDFDTAFAVANPDAINPIEILLESRDEAGLVLGTDTIRLPPLGHTAFVLRDRLATTQGRRGSVRFQSSPRGFGGLGLRFSPFQTFTSFRLLTSRDIQ